jgi:hypothetical protein
MDSQNQCVNIKESLVIFLEMDDIQYSILEDSDKRVLIHATLGFEHGTMGYYIDYQADFKCLHFRSYSNQYIPVNKRNEVQTFYSKLNENTTHWSTTHLNINDGSTFSKSAILIDDMEELNLEIIRKHFGINYNNLAHFMGAALKIGFGNYTSERAYCELFNLENPNLN